MIKHSEEFKQEAVRIALTSGLPRERVAVDLGIGNSTLGKWISQYRPTDLILEPSLIGAYEVKLLPRLFDRSHGSLASLRGRRLAAA